MKEDLLWLPGDHVNHSGVTLESPRVQQVLPHGLLSGKEKWGNKVAKVLLELVLLGDCGMQEAIRNPGMIR